MVSVAGMGVGFGVLGIFFFYALIRSLLDERARHAIYNTQVTDALKELHQIYGCSRQETDQYIKDFDATEKRGTDSAEHDAMIAEIN